MASRGSSASPAGPRIAVTGNRFQVIRQRGISCGVLDVYEGSTRVGTVDTLASANQYRMVPYTGSTPRGAHADYPGPRTLWPPERCPRRLSTRR